VGYLSEQNKQLIHATSLHLLATQGIRVDHVDVLDRLREAGADVQDGRARLSEDWVESTLGSCPGEIQLGGRGSPPASVGVNGGSCYWPGNALYLVDGNERRQITCEDFVGLTRLADHLEHVNAMVGVCVSDFDHTIRDFATLHLMARHTGKHLRPVITSSTGLDAVLEMAQVLNDGRRENVISFGYSILSPLHWAETPLDVISKTSGHGYPLMLNAEPMAGATSPVTLAGSIAQANAETLSGIAIAQVLEPGRPCFHNGGFAHTLDMRTTVALGGSPEVFMMGAASAEMAKFYGLPSASWVSTDALLEDAQAASEKSMGFQLHTQCGVNLIWGMGQLESQMSISAEQLLIDDDIVRGVTRLERGFSVDAQHLAADVIASFADGDDFLTHPHTLKWFRRELSEATLRNRDRRESLAMGGHADMRSRARIRVVEILAQESEIYVNASEERELERIERFWRSKLS
jgi:trimethylamine---corrinoid protein Co-methyltransferase